MSPSLKNIPVSVPPTCARSSTCETAENCPRKPNCVSRSCTNGLLTTTSGSAAGRVLAELRLAPREYLLHPPKSAINARPAATHSLADARPLVFRPMCSARSDPSSVSVAISLVLPIYCSCYLHNLNQSFNASFPGSHQLVWRGLSSPASTGCCAGLEIVFSFQPPHRSIGCACPADQRESHNAN